MSDFEPGEGEQETIKNLIKNLLPTSGIQIAADSQGGYTFDYVNLPPINLPDDTLLQLGKSVGFDPNTSGREMILREMRLWKKYEHIGGAGITSRTMDQVKEVFPLIEDVLASERGKVVILGNGFSVLAVKFAELYQTGQLSEPPVIVDLFDYKNAESDFTNLRKKFGEQHISFPFSEETKNLADIARAIDGGNLKAIQYRVGVGQPPEDLLNASLVVNIHGPAHSSLDEQVSLLRVGGRLVADEDYRTESLGPRLTLQSVPLSRRGLAASIITRTQ